MTSRSHILPLLLCAAASIMYLEAQEAGPLASPAGGGGFVQGPFAPALGMEERPKNARTVIESDDGASFENASSSAEFHGHVVVRDPQFDLTCDNLHVVLRPDHKGLQKVVASGHVVIVQEKKNDRGDLVKSVGKSGKATYDVASGDVSLEEWPQIQQGINNQVGTSRETVMVLNAKGRSRTVGPSRTQIVDQGERAVTP
jgi:lipopolysaccharide export system protein LptA